MIGPPSTGTFHGRHPRHDSCPQDARNPERMTQVPGADVMAMPDPAADPGLTALVPRVSWVRRPVPLSRVVVEAFITAFAGHRARLAGWVAFWLIEQRW